MPGHAAEEYWISWRTAGTMLSQAVMRELDRPARPSPSPADDPQDLCIHVHDLLTITCPSEQADLGRRLVKCVAMLRHQELGAAMHQWRAWREQQVRRPSKSVTPTCTLVLLLVLHVDISAIILSTTAVTQSAPLIL